MAATKLTECPCNWVHGEYSGAWFCGTCQNGEGSDCGKDYPFYKDHRRQREREHYKFGHDVFKPMVLIDPSGKHPPQELQTQVGGDHYTKLAIQPITYILANNLDFCEGAVVKYVSRWRDKGGVEDLKKARDILDKYIQHQESKK